MRLSQAAPLWGIVVVALFVVGGCTKNYNYNENNNDRSPTGPSVVGSSSIVISPRDVRVELTGSGGNCSTTRQFTATIQGAVTATWSTTVPGATMSLGLLSIPSSTPSGTYAVTASIPGASDSVFVHIENRCGGGGGTTSGFNQNVVSCTISSNTLAERTIVIGWTSLAEATSYRVVETFIRPNSSIAEVGETVTVNTPSVTLLRRRWSFRYIYKVYALPGDILWNNGEWTAPCEQMQDPASPPPAPTPTPTPPTTGPGPGGGSGDPTAPTPTPSPTPSTGRAIRITGPSSFGSASGATASATAECSTTGGSSWGGCTTPWWYSQDPSKIQIDPGSGAMRRIGPGSTNICVQWSRTETSPSACRGY